MTPSKTGSAQNANGSAPSTTFSQRPTAAGIATRAPLPPVTAGSLSRNSFNSSNRPVWEPRVTSTSTFRSGR
ncbi:hypothetical protein [Streptomyces nojiriensis]|uniref:hypothetical protein n=1 Tax=Streptomyces nojiriensis TaxID=66374 RepID=UPI00364DCBD4